MQYNTIISFRFLFSLFPCLRIHKDNIPFPGAVFVRCCIQHMHYVSMWIAGENTFPSLVASLYTHGTVHPIDTEKPRLLCLCIKDNYKRLNDDVTADDKDGDDEWRYVSFTFSAILMTVYIQLATGRNEWFIQKARYTMTEHRNVKHLWRGVKVKQKKKKRYKRNNQSGREK